MQASFIHKMILHQNDYAPNANDDVQTLSDAQIKNYRHQMVKLFSSIFRHLQQIKFDEHQKFGQFEIIFRQTS